MIVSKFYKLFQVLFSLFYLFYVSFQKFNEYLNHDSMKWTVDFSNFKQTMFKLNFKRLMSRDIKNFQATSMIWKWIRHNWMRINLTFNTYSRYIVNIRDKWKSNYDVCTLDTLCSLPKQKQYFHNLVISANLSSAQTEVKAYLNDLNKQHSFSYIKTKSVTAFRCSSR